MFFSPALHRSFSGSSPALPHDHFFLKFNAVLVAHTLADVGDQREHIGLRCMPGVDEKIGVAIAHARVTDRVSLQAKLIDHASGGPARRIFENTSCAFL